MSHIDKNLLKSKFHGSLIGSLLGDCLGAPYEGDKISAGDKIVIQKYFDTFESSDYKGGPVRHYTDDTAMLKSVAKCLIDQPEFNCKYLAKLFVKEYYTEPDRGYGQNVVDVFKKLRKSKFEDVYKPASEQFSGTGSYGNGGAMRIAPIALYYYNNYENMLEVAKKSTEITHTHHLGVHGALLQCISIHQALNLDPTKPLDCQQFCNELIDKIQTIETENDDGLGLNDTNPYQLKLELVRDFLMKENDEQLEEDVLIQLGNSISAYDSVPTAIYCFLRAIKDDIKTVQTNNTFRRTIQYAISFGGDTDTIACMAGAIAGAYLGIDGINPSLIKHCEYQEEITKLANNLYNAVVK